jgi:hypothetical protein
MASKSDRAAWTGALPPDGLDPTMRRPRRLLFLFGLIQAGKVS